MKRLEMDGTVYVLVPQDAWQRITIGEMEMPELPPADAEGNREALPFMRAVIARGIIRDRLALGWSQSELSRRSGVRVETLNRIEKARVTADQATITRIDKSLRAGNKASKPKRVRAARK
jgi:ribosome-binding protein aMBF1 (putative translation factor)